MAADTRVSSLIDGNTGGWDSGFVRSSFGAGIASKILQVPLSHHGGDDFPSWPFEKFGFYTMKSAYYMLLSHSFVEVRSRSSTSLQSDTSNEEKLWKRLWKIKV